MSKLPLVIVPDTRLRDIANPIKNMDGRVHGLLQDMLETMYAHRGIGLAAQQVGLFERLIVMDVAEEQQTGAALLMANPEIIASSDTLNTYKEGCLSIPGQYGEITRPKEVRVRYLDITGNIQELDCDGLLATCVQHEIDHLNGKLFIDYLSALKRNMILRKVEKLKKLGEQEGDDDSYQDTL